MIRLLQKLLLRYAPMPLRIRTLRWMGIRVGEQCRIYATNFGSEPFLIRFGDRVVISYDVTFVNHGATWPVQHKHQSLTAFGKIDIKDNVQIGIHSIILPNVTIGPNAIIGAGSVVSRDIPPDSVAAGVPARVVCSLDEYEQKLIAGHLDVPKERRALRRVLERHFWGEDRA